MADRIGLRIDLSNGTRVRNMLKDILGLVQKLDGKTISLKVDTTNLNILEKRIRSIQDGMDKLGKNQSVRFDYAAIEYANNHLKEFLSNLDKLDVLRGAKIHLDTSQARGELDALEGRARSLRETFASIGSGLSGAGYGLQNFGLGGSDTVGLAKRFATYGILRNLTSNNQAAQSRFDILNTYSKYMNVMGVSSEKADASLQKLNKSIQGLPIGLDEGAFDIKKYTMYLNDVEKATNLAIGFDQALIAGGAPEQMRSYAKYEVERLLAGGELATSRQWRSLLNGLGISSVVLAKQFGFEKTTDFATALYKKEVSGEQFLNALMGIPENKEIQDMIDIYKTTFESGASNIAFAITRGKANILKALNETLKTNTGKNLSDYMYVIRDELDSIFISAEKWVRNNPDKLKDMIHMFKDLYASIKQFPWGELAGDVLGSIQKLFKILNGIYKMLPKGALEKIITFMLVWASPLGKALQAFGSVFAIASRMPAVNALMFRRLTIGMDGMGSVVQKMGKLKTSIKGIGTGFLGASAFLGIIAEMGLVIFEFTKIAETIAQAKLKGFWKNFRSVSGFTAIATGIVTAMVGIFSAISSTGIGAAVVGIGELLTAGFVAILAEFGGALKVLVSLASDISSATFPSPTKIREFGTAMAEMTAAASKIHISTTRNQLSKMESALDIATKMSDAIPKLDSIAKSKLDFKAVKEKLRGIMDSLNVLVADSKDAGLLKKWKSGNQLAVIENITQVITTLDGLRTSLYHMQESKLFKRNKRGTTGLEDSINNAKAAIGAINDLLTTFAQNENGENKPLPLQWYDKRSSANWQVVLENAENAIKSITNIVTELDNLKLRNLVEINPATGHSNIEMITESITAIIDAVNQMAADIDENSGRSNTNGQSPIMNLQTQMNTLVAVAGQISEFVNTLSGLREKIAGITENGLGLGKLISQLTGVFAGENSEGTMGLSVNVAVFSTAIQNMANALSSLQEVDISGFTTSIQEAIAQLDVFKTKLLEVNKQLKRISTNADTASERIVSLADTSATIEFSTFNSQLMVLSSMLGMAAISASSLASAINSIPTSKEVTVTYRRNGGLGGPFGWFHNGGPVYLAEGGNPMKPRGTDTIPAMLTQGEFVMRRRAVTTFGQKFMENVNKLNIGGAMKELMHRTPMSGGYIDNSRHYDNHATVNQYYHSAGESHSYRRAYRFVNAL